MPSSTATRVIVAIDGAADATGRFGRGSLDLLQRRQDRVGHERRAAGEQGVEDRAETVDVGGDRDAALDRRGLLGRHVAGGADHGA